VRITDDLQVINKEVCRQLWVMVDEGNTFSTVTPFTPRLILPSLSGGDLRLSEQEARFIYGLVVNRTSDYYFSVETPTTQGYSFTGTKRISARVDLTLFTHGDDAFDRAVNVEFKAKNPTQASIDKDVEKFCREPVLGSWFHILLNIDSGTLPSILGKIVNSFASVQVPASTVRPILFTFVVLDERKKWAMQKLFAPKQNLATEAEKFFRFGYSVSRGQITVTDANGWDCFSHA